MINESNLKAPTVEALNKNADISIPLQTLFDDFIKFISENNTI